MVLIHACLVGDHKAEPKRHFNEPSICLNLLLPIYYSISEHFVKIGVPMDKIGIGKWGGWIVPLKVLLDLFVAITAQPSCML